MPSVDIWLSLSRKQCLDYYEGQVQQVYAQSLDGRRVAFPARVLNKVVGKQGVEGYYRLSFSDEGRFESLEKVPILGR
ncbi:Protein of unknown function [Onishia taeanensis]|uniref:DUF2835 family protein n=1 Tax=Onishia taeanensis TaxID=284577 RepID=A0A1G7REB0_9GAMM|nr:DUF2835 family protein [Halomonas taeanensis]SDG08509.1 Protein of unknown function [Halomonas taeanensis]